MSLGEGSGQASAANSSLRFVTATVRAGVAAEPPVVPMGSESVVTAPQPSLTPRMSRPPSETGVAAQALPRRKPMDNKYASTRARHGKNINFPRGNWHKRSDRVHQVKQ